MCWLFFGFVSPAESCKALSSHDGISPVSSDVELAAVDAQPLFPLSDDLFTKEGRLPVLSALDPFDESRLKDESNLERSERKTLAGPYLPRKNGPRVSSDPATMNTGGSISAQRML